MTDHVVASGGLCPGEELLPAVDGEGADLTPDLDDGIRLMPDVDLVAAPSDTLTADGTTDRDHVIDAIWRWLGVGAVAALALVAVAVLPPGRPALAEAPLGQPITVGMSPFAVGVNPATNRIYVSNNLSGTVSVIDGATSSIVGSPIPVGTQPAGVAVNPVTNRIYVPSFDGNVVRVIDGATNTVIGSPIAVGNGPALVAVNTITNRVYVTNQGGKSVSVIDGATNTVVGSPIAVGEAPVGVAVNPTTNRVYVGNRTSNNLFVIDGATNAVIGAPIPFTDPVGIDVNPSTNRFYVVSQKNKSVTVFDGATNTAIGPPISAGEVPTLIAANAATNRIYVSNTGSTNVTVIDGATNSAVGSPVAVVAELPNGIGVNTATGRVYVTSLSGGNVTVLDVPLDTRPSTSLPGGAFTATWNKLFAPNGGDFVGLYAPGAPNTSPLSRRFTNGTATAGGAGLDTGSADVPFPPTLAAGSYEIRLIAGATGGTLATRNASTPTAASDSFTIGMSGLLNVPAPGVLANDTDPTSPSLTAAVATNPTHGALVLQPNGAFTYQPGITFSGSDTFTYRAANQAGLTATATVTITVTAVPVGANDAYTASSGAVLTVPAPGVLANDVSDVAASLQAVLGTNPAHGTLHLQADGGFTYTPAAGFSGTDGFTYRASDGSSFSLPVMVTLTVTMDPCAPRPKVTVTTTVAGGKLTAHVQTSPLNTQQQNGLKSLRFGALQNATVTVAGQPVANGQALALPGTASTLDFTVERATPGQAVTAPFTVVDGCGEWQTFVGGGPGAGF